MACRPARTAMVLLLPLTRVRRTKTTSLWSRRTKTDPIVVEANPTVGRIDAALPLTELW